jgi:hypothetical protein
MKPRLAVIIMAIAALGGQAQAQQEIAIGSFSNTFKRGDKEVISKTFAVSLPEPLPGHKWKFLLDAVSKTGGGYADFNGDDKTYSEYIPVYLPDDRPEQRLSDTSYGQSSGRVRLSLMYDKYKEGPGPWHISVKIKAVQKRD